MGSAFYAPTRPHFITNIILKEEHLLGGEIVSMFEKFTAVALDSVAQCVRWYEMRTLLLKTFALGIVVEESNPCSTCP